MLIIFTYRQYEDLARSKLCTEIVLQIKEIVAKVFCVPGPSARIDPKKIDILVIPIAEGLGSSINGKLFTVTVFTPAIPPGKTRKGVMEAIGRKIGEIKRQQVGTIVPTGKNVSLLDEQPHNFRGKVRVLLADMESMDV